MWLTEQQRKELRPVLRDVAHITIFLLGVAAVALGIFTHDLGLIAAGTTLFGLVGIVRA